MYDMHPIFYLYIFDKSAIEPNKNFKQITIFTDSTFDSYCRNHATGPCFADKADSISRK